ncbi:hypothetical protein HK405_011452 [Cladochytrium tenue]|nr:hypothetical protein HK405_011452 [Cladochytrium tenue]
MQADGLKALGNKAFSAGDFPTAIRHFTDAIALDPKNHVLYSNRSAAYASQRDYIKALEDAEKTVELNPTWAKAYSRRGAALYGLARYPEAVEAYDEGLRLEPENAQIKKGLEDAKAALDEGPGPDMMSKLFSGDVFAKIAGNPKLAPYLAQPDFLQKVREIQQNPNNLTKHMQDPRILTLAMSLMGLDATAMGRDEMEATYDMQSEPAPAPSSSSSRPAPSAKAPEPEPMHVEEEVDDEEKEQRNKRKLSDERKDAGNKLYKSRKFEDAIKAYDEAWEADDSNVAVLTNKSAVLFEMGKYEECIKACEDAVEKGREHRADFKLIAKAFARIGGCYTKLDDLASAIKFYSKSLAEHREPSVLAKLREAEKLKEQRDKEGYRDLGLSDAARERGNELFRAARFADAVKEYSEAIRRNDSDARAYSNRAACYLKLMAVHEAERDCDEAIRLDPDFAKAYVRKAAVLAARREWSKVFEVCETAKQKDVDGKNRAEIDAQLAKAYAGLNEAQSGGNREEVLKRAMADPEVQKIMADPIMNQILQQMKEDPKAAQDHMRNPAVAANIRKLMDAGIIQVR